MAGSVPASSHRKENHKNTLDFDKDSAKITPVFSDNLSNNTEASSRSSSTGRLKSMHQFLAEKKTDFGLRFNGDVPSFVETDFPGSAGARHPFRLLSLPLYLASEARRLVEERL